MSIISHQYLKFEVLVSLPPVAPSLVSKKVGPGLQDVLPTSAVALARQGYLSRFWFSHSTVSDSSNRCVEKEARSKRAKAASSFCLTLWLGWQRDNEPPGMCTEAHQPRWPELGST